jgi:hypothetical protein
VFLDQILRRQEEYIKSLGPITKPAQKKPLRVKKAPTTLKVVPVYIPDEIEDEIESAIVVEVDDIASAIVVEVDETVPEPSLIDTRLIPAYIEPTDDELEEIELLDSGTFELDVAVTENTTIDLASIFDKYVPKTKGAKMTYKMVGLPVPLDIHARMLKFMEANKDKPGAPKSLKDFGLMCLGYTLDDLETSKIDGV